MFHQDDPLEEGEAQAQLRTSGDGDTDQGEPESVTSQMINKLIIFLLLLLVKLVTFINQNPILSLCLVIVMFLAKINSF